MNIIIVEPNNTRTNAICCGDSLYGTLPIKNVKKRSDEMPRDNVVVYCASCIKAMHIGGRKPRYMIDLLFGEETGIGTFEPDEWHNELQKFVDEH